MNALNAVCASRIKSGIRLSAAFLSLISARSAFLSARTFLEAQTGLQTLCMGLCGANARPHPGAVHILLSGSARLNIPAFSSPMDYLGGCFLGGHLARAFGTSSFLIVFLKPKFPAMWNNTTPSGSMNPGAA